MTATVFKEGHDRLAVVVRYRRDGEKTWHETPMTLVNPGLDLWQASLPLEQNTRYRYTIEAWHDAFESWRAEIGKKRDAGQDVHLELIEGRNIVADVETRAKGPDVVRLRHIVAAFDAQRAATEALSARASARTCARSELTGGPAGGNRTARAG